MPQKPTVLCPIDYSDHSRVALRYAALIADHFGARLLLVTVNDLLLVQAAAMAYDAEYLQLQSQQDLREFYRDTNLPSAAGADDVTYDVRTGKPAPEILKAAADGHADLIVIGTHGLSGARKAFFGATTERVLRETTVPVLVTRKDAPMVASLPEVAPVRRTHSGARRSHACNRPPGGGGKRVGCRAGRAAHTHTRHRTPGAADCGGERTSAGRTTNAAPGRKRSSASSQTM